ncbi:MAG: CFI-box-CTERM domain-containing protein [Lachnospiraceae bacterium]
MEFVQGKCPECKEILHIPTDRDSVICMFCGAKIIAAEAIDLDGGGQQEPADNIVAEKKNEFNSVLFEELRSKAVEGMEDMVLSVKNPMNTFNRKVYEPNFRDYCKKYEDILNAVLDAAFMIQETDAFYQKLADEFVARMEGHINELSKKREREDRLLDCNMIMVTYFFPAMLEGNDRSLIHFADVIAGSWKKHFPSANLEPASFERINSGFKKRFCYITTAVCKSLNKPDQCYELTVLRSYRDDYLMNTEQGCELIKEYYDVAPTIVKHIDKKPNSTQIYKQIWEEFLSPCIKLIENDKNEECEYLYETMVYQLKDRYFQ